MGPAVRAMTRADIQTVDQIAMAAYGSSSRSKELARYVSVQPDGWLLAELEGRTVGLGGMIDYGAFAYIGLMAVLPEYQRRGVGRAIMLSLLDRLDRRGCAVARLDASPAGAPLYANLGFAEDDHTVVYARGAQLMVPAQRDAHVEPWSVDDVALRMLAAYDAEHFGAARAPLLASYVRDNPSRALVYRASSGSIGGYVVAQAQKIGPWIATTPDAADALLWHALKLDFEGPPIVLVPAENAQAVSLLERHGFERTRALSHMRRGGAAVPNWRARVYGLASFATG